MFEQRVFLSFYLHSPSPLFVGSEEKKGEKEGEREKGGWLVGWLVCYEKKARSMSSRFGQRRCKL